MTSSVKEPDSGRTAHHGGKDESDNALLLPNVEEVMSERNIRIAVCGNVDAGKSTLVGTLKTSTLDDGKGKARSTILKYRHEIESGRTSTVTSHLVGFKETGEPIVANVGGGHAEQHRRKGKRMDENIVVREADRVVTLIDLAGHEKYLKTTIHGVSSGFADYALILVNASQPPTHMTEHHLNLCCAFGIPVIVLLTKVDLCPKHVLKNTKAEVVKMLRSPDVGRKPYAIRNEDDVETVWDKLHSVAPVLSVSCVTGEGLDLLRRLMFVLPKRRRHQNKIHRPFEFLVEDIFNVPGVGPIVYGFVNAGELQIGESVYVGPLKDGTFVKTTAKSAHVARTVVTHVCAGESVCLALSLNKDQKKMLRRGMVVLKEGLSATRTFDAEVCVLKGEGTTIRNRYQTMVHILHVRQAARVTDIEIIEDGYVPTACSAFDSLGNDGGVVLRPGSRAKIRFEFVIRPEYIRKGMRLLFRDGAVRGVGVITETL